MSKNCRSRFISKVLASFITACTIRVWSLIQYLFSSGHLVANLKLTHLSEYYILLLEIYQFVQDFPYNGQLKDPSQMHDLLLKTFSGKTDYSIFKYNLFRYYLENFVKFRQS